MFCHNYFRKGILPFLLTIAIIWSGSAGALAAGNEQVLSPIPVRAADVTLNSAGLQADLSFPDCRGEIQKNLIANNMYSFQGYAGQGKLYITCSNGLRSADVFVNGIPADISAACGANGKSFEMDISSVSKNGRNTIQVTNFEPADGKLNVKIPYPIVREGSPSDVGIEKSKLDAIDLMIQKDIQYGYTSGQLAIIKDGVMIKNTAYGKINSYNPDGTRKSDSPDVTTSTLYDLASNTKMYATNYALQKLVTEKKIAITDKITKYFPDFQDDPQDSIKGKANLTIQNLLEHQAGFPAGPHYYDEKFDMKTQKHDEKAVNHLFSQDRQTTLKMIMKTPLQYEPGSKTVYSDVDYMLLGLIVEKVTGMPLDTYVEKNIYQPLGLNHLVFNPLKKGFAKTDCAATELNGNTRDGTVSFKNIRKATIQGEVHDEKAFYCMDGVSGHAGLFGNASDLAKLCQVMLNGGGYGDTKLFSATEIDNFTKPKYANSTYGLGWRRSGDNGYISNFGVQSPRSTVGHTGWTGTLTVIDPSNNLIIVWLGNKVNSPVVDKATDPNTFVGNGFASASYGAITTLVYDAVENNSLDTFDANISQMAIEKIQLINQEKNPVMKKALLNSACSLVDTAVTRAEQLRTQAAVNYAKKAVASLSPLCDAQTIRAFNQRLGAVSK
jgi:CubicO group peptidase (beta-lactamase class C family)